jgi:hypothetical protein
MGTADELPQVKGLDQFPFITDVKLAELANEMMNKNNELSRIFFMCKVFEL